MERGKGLAGGSLAGGAQTWQAQTIRVRNTCMFRNLFLLLSLVNVSDEPQQCDNPAGEQKTEI